MKILKWLFLLFYQESKKQQLNTWYDHDWITQPVENLQAVEVEYADGYKSIEPAYNVFWSVQQVREKYDLGKVPKDLGEVIVCRYRLLDDSNLDHSDRAEKGLMAYASKLKW